MVLLLNSTHEPIGAISPQVAVNLIIQDKVYPATSDNKYTFRSPSTTIHVPSAVALVKYVNLPRKKVAWTKWRVLERDNFTCGYCGKDSSQISKSAFTVDHIHPKIKGGQDTWENTICACYECNQRKGSKLLADIDMQLLWQPRPYQLTDSQIHKMYNNLLLDGNNI